MREIEVEIQMDSIQTEACEWLKLQTEGLMYAKDKPETAALIKKAEAAREFYLGADFAIAREPIRCSLPWPPITMLCANW